MDLFLIDLLIHQSYFKVDLIAVHIFVVINARACCATRKWEIAEPTTNILSNERKHYIMGGEGKRFSLSLTTIYFKSDFFFLSKIKFEFILCSRMKC